MEESNSLMDIDETDFIFPPITSERKSSFSSIVTASSSGSRDKDILHRAKRKPSLVLNSKFSSRLYIQNERWTAI